MARAQAEGQLGALVAELAQKEQAVDQSRQGQLRSGAADSAQTAKVGQLAEARVRMGRDLRPKQGALLAAQVEGGKETDATACMVWIKETVATLETYLEVEGGQEASLVVPTRTPEA